MTIIEHAEKYLGTLDQGWRDGASDKDIQIALFKDTPRASVATYLSLGMSGDVLSLSEAKKVRQELVLSVDTLSISSMLVSFLMSLCEAILARAKAVLRGEVIPLSRELVKRIGFDAAYCTIPVFFDNGFRTFEDSVPDTVMVWVIPIYRSEASYIETHGWESFEDLLERKDPDLFSLEREPVV